MGQRLVIHCEKGGEEIANCYYHWSGYSDSSVERVQQVIHSLEKFASETDPALRCVKAFQDYDESFFHIIDNAAPEKMTAILVEKDLEEAKKRWPDQVFRAQGNRNTGLISITKETMAESTKWEEAAAHINLDDETFYIDAFWFEDEDSYQDYWQAEENMDFETYVQQDRVYDFDASDIYSWKQIDEYADIVFGHEEFYTGEYLVTKIQ